MKRSSLSRQTPLRSSHWGVSTKPRTPLPQINPERQARVKRRRARQRYSKAEKAARAKAWLRANGVCECGCGVPFDTSDGQYAAGYPEFHHEDYDPPVGKYLRRACHHRIEKTQFGYRHSRRSVA